MNPELIKLIDNINVNINPSGMQTLNIVLGLVMFGVALGIKTEDFVQVAKRPKSALAGIISQVLLLPALTFVLALAMKDFISPMIGLGMILVASCPGGNVSNFISSISKANVSLSVSLTALNTAMAMFTTPTNFALWGGLYLRYTGMRAALPELEIPFWEIFQTIVILLGIPLVAGMLCARYLPKITGYIQKPLQIISLIFFVVIVILALGQNMDAFKQCIWYIFPIVLIHNLLAMLIGYGMGRVTRVSRSDRRTLTIETGIQNSGLGLILLFNPIIFKDFPPHGGMLVITAWWGIWHIISGLACAGAFNIFKKL